MSRLSDAQFNALASEVYKFIQSQQDGASPFKIAKLDCIQSLRFGRSVRRRILRQLLEDGLICQEGTRRSTLYRHTTF